MLNEERVILMTHMASYENGEGKDNIKVGSYFRSDYITVQVLKSFICSSIAFAILFALYVFYDLEVFMQNLYKMDLFAFAKKILIYYGVTVVGYGLLTYFVSTYRYARAKGSLKRYYNNLRKMSSLYGGEAASKRTTGGRK